MSLSIGQVAPDFALLDTEGRKWSVASYDGAPSTVVVFTCNHCPYALAWQDRIAEVADDYAARGVRVLAVNSNDADRYPRDSLDAMKDRVSREQWTIPYVHDADYDNPGERAEWLREALDSVLSGSILERPETKPVGCSIKWK